MANNTSVEWSCVTYSNGENAIIGNSHEKTRTSSMLESMDYHGAQNVKEAIHSHPSEPYAGRTDKGLVAIYREFFSDSKAKFSIYHVPSKNYIEYDDKNTIYDPSLFNPF